MTIPIEVKGVAPGAVAGGILEEHLDRIEVQCLVTSLPDSIDVPLRGLQIGDAIHAGDVILPPDVTLVTEPDALLVACHPPIVAVEDEGEAEERPESPEVISEARREEEEKDSSES